MEKRRIVLRADAGKSIGYGHLVRSTALAGYLKEDFDCYFASFGSGPRDLSRKQMLEILKVSTPFCVRGDTIERYDRDFLDQICPDDIVVLDNYYFSTEFQRAIKDKGCKLVCLDDVHDRHMLCDILFTPCPLERDDFSLEPHCEFYGGIKWAFLRQPFLAPVPVRNITTDIRKIVMAMGGADAFNLTDKMIHVIHEAMPCAHLDVICGPSVDISEESMRLADVHKNLSADQMVSLFDKADTGIFPASTVCIEAFSRKLPVMAGYYVDNQREFHEYGINNGYFASLGCLLDDAGDILSRLETVLLHRHPLPVVMDFNGQKDRVVQIFKELAKN